MDQKKHPDCLEVSGFDCWLTVCSHDMIAMVGPWKADMFLKS